MEHEYSFPKPWEEIEDAKDAEIKRLREENAKSKEREQAMMDLNVRTDLRLQKEHDARMVDDLTGLNNDAAFTKKFEEMTMVPPGAEQRKSPPPATLLMLDLDGFKPVNDTYGHEVGDIVLKQTADFLKNICREGDFPVRLHGDEFAVIFFNTSPEELLARFQQQEGEAGGKEVTGETTLPFPIEIPALNNKSSVLPLGVTFSAGLVEIVPGATLATIKKLGDDAMYEAKRAGKNRVRLAKNAVTRKS